MVQCEGCSHRMIYRWAHILSYIRDRLEQYVYASLGLAASVALWLSFEQLTRALQHQGWWGAPENVHRAAQKETHHARCSCPCSENLFHAMLALCPQYLPAIPTSPDPDSLVVGISTLCLLHPASIDMRNNTKKDMRKRHEDQ